MSYTVSVDLFPLSKEDTLKFLDENKIKYNEFFELYLFHEKYKSIKETGTRKVAVLKLSELGLNKPAGYTEIKEAAIRAGYRLCEPNIGIYLRLALKEQKKSGNSILSGRKSPEGAVAVLSDRLEDDSTFPANTYLRNVDDELWLRASRFDDLYEFDLDTEFAVMLPAD